MYELLFKGELWIKYDAKQLQPLNIFNCNVIKRESRVFRQGCCCKDWVGKEVMGNGSKGEELSGG